ncbi:CRTAC1 family protein [bacterium]|nr:CRTAC1 family protein [bacterium]
MDSSFKSHKQTDNAFSSKTIFNSIGVVPGLFSLVVIVLSFATLGFAEIPFTDVASISGVNKGGRGAGAAFGDFDNDGYLDIYVVNNAQSNALYHNDKTGIFTDVTDIAGLNHPGTGVAAAIADYDNDGDLDIYLVNRLEPNILYRNNGDGTFTDVTSAAGVGGAGEGAGASFGDYDRDGYLDIYVTRRGPNILYRNNGDGTFTDVTALSKVGNPGWSVGVAFGDYDNDGDLDIYLTNNLDQTNVLYRNNSDGTFSDVTESAGVGDTGNGMGTTFGDYDNDGDLDIYVANWGRNVLYRNNGDGTFADVSKTSGTDDIGNGVGAVFSDYDNDGDLDLYVVNWGHPHIVYSNNGGGHFTSIVTALRPDDTGGGALAAGDFDNDGDMDIYELGTNNQSNALYRNDTATNNWLVVKTVGTVGNRDGIGARVRIVCGKLSMVREVGGGLGYGSQESLPVEFGLGGYSRADRIEVTWPTGKRTTLTEISANQVITIKETKQ